MAGGVAGVDVWFAISTPVFDGNKLVSTVLGNACLCRSSAGVFDLRILNERILQGGGIQRTGCPINQNNFNA